MTVFYPESVGAQGKDVWIFVPAIASSIAATVAEVTATGSCVLQNAFRPGFGADAETEKIQDERQGSLVVYDQNGTTKVTLGDMILIDRPQDAPGTAARKHLDTLSGARGFLVNRRGLGSSVENWVPVAAGQRYVGYPVSFPILIPIAPGDTKAFERKVAPSVTGAIFEGTFAA